MLSILVSTSLLIGSLTALFLPDLSEKEASRICYKAYQDKWELIKREEGVILPVNVVEFNLLKITARAFNLTEINEFLSGVDNMNNERYAEATRNFERVSNSRAAHHIDRLSLLFYGYCKQRTRDHQGALNAYDKLEIYPDNILPERLFHTAAIYGKHGMTEMAEKYYQRYKNAHGD